MLTDKQIQGAKARTKLYGLADGNGLHLEVTPVGGKHWRLRYRFRGKEKMLALGAYPAVRVPQARQRAGEARQELEAGRDPSAEKQRAKRRWRGYRGTALSRQWPADGMRV